MGRNMRRVKNVAVVSLSSGTIGEPFAKHELETGVKRLEAFGLNVRFMPHALMGIEYVRNHPEKRASDLLEAFRDPDIDMILCAIGGDDTYRLLPYLFDHDELEKAVSNMISDNMNSDKVFLGFSDTTINHFMLHKLGLTTFYGQSFLADICELDNEMLPYTRKYFEELISTGRIREIRPSEVWYDERKSFGVDQIGVPRTSHANTGFELLQGKPVFGGRILGGCIDSIYDIFDNSRYADSVSLCKKYSLFPPVQDWTGRILLLETSEEKPDPATYRKMLEKLKKYGIFDVISGVLAGKPMDETYFDEYKKILVEVIDDPTVPVVCNINIGHATPRCIMPFGIEAVVDTEKQVIRFAE